MLYAYQGCLAELTVNLALSSITSYPMTGICSSSCSRTSVCVLARDMVKSLLGVADEGLSGAHGERSLRVDGRWGGLSRNGVLAVNWTFSSRSEMASSAGLTGLFMMSSVSDGTGTSA